ncbi:MAG: group I intron-associated PD-(D/E)XK endonuclease [Ktedonobacteraceae bacterium]
MGLPNNSKRTTNTIGDISEAAIIARFLQIGYVVLTVYGGNQRYDLLIEDANSQFWRVQCKTARVEANGTVVAFDTANHNYALKTKQWRHYRGQCDYFAAYCEELHKIYFVPVDQVGTTRANLRLAPAKNNQVKKVRWAQDYEL